MLKKPESFCSFCIIESHIQGIIQARKKGNRRVRPIGIYLLFQFIGGGLFELGVQNDAQEFLFSLLDNMTQASLGYLRRVPFPYEKLTFVPNVFQGKFERQVTCEKCKNTYRRSEDFLSLQLTMVQKQ